MSSILFKPGQLFHITDDGIAAWNRWYTKEEGVAYVRPPGTRPYIGETIMFLSSEETDGLPCGVFNRAITETLIFYKVLAGEKIFFILVATTRRKAKRLTSLMREKLYSDADDVILAHCEPIELPSSPSQNTL